MRAPALALAVATLAAAATGCIPPPTITGTTVPDTKANRQVIEVCERYRHALEDRDGETLLAMAAPSYFEDSGTPKAEDDYGYDGLRTIIQNRLQSLKAVRYNIQYRRVTWGQGGARASVDVRYDASYQMTTELGDRWERKQSEKRFELEYDRANHRWLFTSGM